MKKISITKHIAGLTAALAMFVLPSQLQATPYASGATNNAGTVSFYLNESGGNVTVKYEDGTTNSSFNGTTTGLNVAKGVQSFSLGAHTGYAISVYKIGNGVPSQISVDSSNLAVYGTPRGMAVNSNPKYGGSFGRIYCGSGAISGSGATAKYHGLYAMNSDLSDALGKGTNAFAQGLFGPESSSAPYKMRVNPDGSLLVNDFSGNGALWMFSSDLSVSNAIFLQSQPGGIHGDMLGTAKLLTTTTNINGINYPYYTLWVFDSGLGVPSGTTLGPGTSIGSYNCAYRYDVGTNFGPNPLTNPNLLYTNPPNYAYTVGLDGIAELRIEGDIGQDGKIICGFFRANLSNPNVQIVDSTGTTKLWDSWNDTGGLSDPWSGLFTVGADVGGTYGGIRVSPDGRFLCAVDVQNGFTIASLTNGIPDDSSLFGIQNASNTGNARGMDWDAADNVYECSSGQGLLRIWSLGITTTCITSNDITGTNGAFQLILPQVSATVVTTQNASQNYINNASPGTPIPGIFTIALTTNVLSAPVTVNFTRSGTAVLNTNYTINVGPDANGVAIGTNSVTFPAGTYPSVGNWQAKVILTPTATPVSGPTLTATVRLLGGAQSIVATPGTASLVISNTGPQLLFVSAAANGSSMSRNVPNDFAKFVITRWGDLNGPGNSPSSVNQVTYTVTNFTYNGAAIFPADFTALAQRIDPAGDGNIALPTDGSPGVVIYPGNVTVTAIVGNPVRHSNLSAPPVNVTIGINPTNAVTGTNETSVEGYPYLTTQAGVVLQELDNTVGPEVVLWSNPLTNALDSVNWTLTFAATNKAAGPVLPVVVPNYTNGQTSISAGGTNDFRVTFGWPVGNDSLPPSPAMVANGWSNVVKMTVNKDGGNSQAGVNLYPQGQNFAGNYALRFSMYLSMYSSAINNPSPGTYPREYALFGVNHKGTNCNWRTTFPIPPNPGYAAMTNADGVWFAIDAGAGAISPADFDAFTSPALPNSGVVNDYQSSTSLQEQGVFKSPPFASQNIGASAGGQPINQWVDVSVEITSQTNVNVLMNRSLVIPSFTLTNGGGNYISGKPMLGYLDPVPDQSDSSAFVYYSNIRVVELSPYITAQPSPTSYIVVQGSSLTNVTSATYATAPITNTWYKSNTNPVPVSAVQTDTANATNLTSVLVLSNVQTGTNYQAVFSDAAGSVTGLVVSVEVIIGPTNRTVNAGSNFVAFAVIPSGPAAPTAYQWKTNGVNLVNGSHFAGVTTAVLTITNAQLSDAVTYTCGVTNAAGGLLVSANLAVIAPAPTFANVSIVSTNAVLNFTTPNGFDNTGSFTLQSSGLVQGPYTNTSGTVTGSNGTFQFKVPYTTNSAMFYRLKHN